MLDVCFGDAQTDDLSPTIQRSAYEMLRDPFKVKKAATLVVISLNLEPKLRTGFVTSGFGVVVLGVRFQVKCKSLRKSLGERSYFSSTNLYQSFTELRRISWIYRPEYLETGATTVSGELVTVDASESHAPALTK